MRRLPGWADILLVMASTVLMSVLSLLFIGNKSFTIDEAISISSARDWSQMWQILRSYEANMWLYYIMLNPWMKLGHSEAITRALSAVFAVATIPAIYFLGRRLFGSRAGAIAALMVASNAYFIRYAQEARSYTLLVLLVTLSALFFVRAVQAASWKNWLGHALCSALAIYAHYFAALAYFVHVVSLPLLSPRNLPWRGFAFSILVLSILLIPLVVLQPLNSGMIGWINPPTASDVYSFFVDITGNRSLLLFYFIFCSATLIAVLRTSPYRRAQHELWGHLLIAIWALAPLAVTLVFSWVVKPNFQSRYLMISLPALALLAGAGISRLKRPWLQAAVLLVMLCLSARAISKWYIEYTKEDWRSTTRYVLSEAQPGDGAVFYSFWVWRAFVYYQERLDGNRTGLRVLDLGLLKPDGRTLWHLDEALLSSLPGRYNRIWLILCHDKSFYGDPEKDRIIGTIENSYTKVEERDFLYTRGRIRVILYNRMRSSQG
jgi:4-amino-4-deoxy-L-arabinose transferase-like glycosyltransferase